MIWWVVRVASQRHCGLSRKNGPLTAASSTQPAALVSTWPNLSRRLGQPTSRQIGGTRLTRGVARFWHSASYLPASCLQSFAHSGVFMQRLAPSLPAQPKTCRFQLVDDFPGPKRAKRHGREASRERDDGIFWHGSPPPRLLPDSNAALPSQPAPLGGSSEGTRGSRSGIRAGISRSTTSQTFAGINRKYS